MTKKPFFITTPIYYVNDAPHLGSAYTTIAADVLNRHYAAQNIPTLFLTGTDEHGKKIADSAAAKNQKEQVFADAVSKQFKAAWAALNIRYDTFIRTTDTAHIANVQHQFELLKEKDLLYKGTYEGLYCVSCEEYKQPNDLMEGGLCSIHRRKVEEIKEDVWFFKLSGFTAKLKELIERGTLVIEPERRRNETLGWLKEGLRDLAVSRSKVKWGIPLPWDKAQTIYVWADALLNYHTARAQAWPPDVQIIGKDILRFHAIIWPALLLGLGLDLPKKIFAHGFFTVAGHKMTKTLKNVVDPVALCQKYGVDTLRYFLLREFPFGDDGDFSEEKLQQRYKNDLQHDLGNLVQRVLTMEEKYTVKIEPGIAPRCAQAELHTQKLEFDKALIEIWNLVRAANELIDREKPWVLSRTDPKKLTRVLTTLHRMLETIGAGLEPYLPETASRIKTILAAGKPAAPLFPPLK